MPRFVFAFTESNPVLHKIFCSAITLGVKNEEDVVGISIETL